MLPSRLSDEGRISPTLLFLSYHGCAWPGDPLERTQTPIVENIRDALDAGAALSDVDSTDEELMLVLEDEGSEAHYRLDADETRALVETGTLARIEDTEHPIKAV